MSREELGKAYLTQYIRPVKMVNALINNFVIVTYNEIEGDLNG